MYSEKKTVRVHAQYFVVSLPTSWLFLGFHTVEAEGKSVAQIFKILIKTEAITRFCMSKEEIENHCKCCETFWRFCISIRHNTVSDVTMNQFLSEDVQQLGLKY